MKVKKKEEGRSNKEGGRSKKQEARRKEEEERRNCDIMFSGAVERCSTFLAALLCLY
jgi:hypothetical protein